MTSSTSHAAALPPSSTTTSYTLTLNDDLHETKISITLNPFIQEQLGQFLSMENLTGASSSSATHHHNASAASSQQLSNAPLYSIHEDKILLAASLNSASSSPQYAKIYRQKAKHDSKTFPKAKYFTNQMGRDRVAWLRNHGKLRYSILCRVIQEEAQQREMKLEREEEQKRLQDEQQRNDSDEEELPSQDSAKLQNHSDSSQSITSKQREKHLSILRNLSPSDVLVNIVLTGEEFEMTRLHSTERLLKENSLYLRKILDRLDARNLDSSSGEIEFSDKDAPRKYKEIGFSEYDEKYKAHEFFRAFHPETFSKFLTFCENSDIQQKYFSMLDRYAAFHNESQKTLDDALQDLRESFKATLESLTERMYQERIQLKSFYETCLQKDIQRLSTLYRSQLDAQMSKLDQYLDRKRAELESFYDEEIKLTQQLYTDHQQIRKNQLIKEKKETELLLNHTLPPASLPSIFILSDVLQAEELKTICMNRIADDFESYRQNKAFSSTLLSTNAVTQLLTRLSTDTLLSLMDKIDYAFPTAFVSKEVEYRKSLARSTYHSKPLATLIEMSLHPDKYEVQFPDLVQEELVARRGAKPHVSIQSSPFVLDDELTVVHSTASKNYITHYANQSRDYNGFSKWFFEVLVEELPSEYGSTVNIGWGVSYDDVTGRRSTSPSLVRSSSRSSVLGSSQNATDSPMHQESTASIFHVSDHSQKQKVIGLTKNYKGEAGFALSSEGLFYHNGERELLPVTVKAGDIVGCAMDQIKKRLEFFVNGKTIVLSGASALKLSLNYKLYPGVSVYHAHNDCSVRVKFNFAGPFKYPVNGFEAYGDPVADRKLR